jgi:hypothetical protein
MVGLIQRFIGYAAYFTAARNEKRLKLWRCSSRRPSPGRWIGRIQTVPQTGICAVDERRDQYSLDAWSNE